MPEGLSVVPVKETARAHPVTAMAASPWAPLVAIAGHGRIYLYNLTTRQAAGELAFPEGVPYVLRFSRDGATLLAGAGCSPGRSYCSTCARENAPQLLARNGMSCWRQM